MKTKHIQNKFNSLNVNSENYNSDLENLLIEIDSRMNELLSDKEKRLYPKRHSEIESYKINGLLEENLALTFLSTPQPSGAIIQRILRDWELNRVDSVSILFEKVIPQIPINEAQWIELHRINTEKYDMLKQLKGIYNSFNARYGIDIIDHELKSINQLKQNIQSLLQEV